MADTWGPGDLPIGAAAAAPWGEGDHPIGPAPAAPEPPSPQYSGGILPFSVDAQGNKSFDSNAGILGAFKRMVTLPEQVVSGQMPVVGPDGRTSPELVQRSTEFNLMNNPGLRGMAEPRQAMPTVPSARELKATGSAGYTEARNAGFEIDPSPYSDLAARLQNDLTKQGFGSKVAPSAHGMLDEVANPAPLSGAGNPRRLVTIDDILALRDNLGNISRENAKDATAGGIAKRALDDFLGSLDPSSVTAGTASPEAMAATLRTAQGNWGASQKSNTLTGTLDRATTGVLERAEGRAAAANSGQNIDNAIRQRIASLLEQPKEVSGLSDAEISALEKVRDGGFLQNRLRDVANILGGGRGIAASGLAMGGSALSGGGPGGLALGASLPLGGAIAKMIENAMSKRALSGVDEAVRMNSPMFRELLGQQPWDVPPIDAQSAVIRALMPGLLGYTQQRQGLLPQPQQQPQRGLLGPPA